MRFVPEGEVLPMRISTSEYGSPLSQKPLQSLHVASDRNMIVTLSSFPFSSTPAIGRADFLIGR